MFATALISALLALSPAQADEAVDMSNYKIASLSCAPSVGLVGPVISSFEKTFEDASTTIVMTSENDRHGETIFRSSVVIAATLPVNQTTLAITQTPVDLGKVQVILSMPRKATSQSPVTLHLKSSAVYEFSAANVENTRPPGMSQFVYRFELKGYSCTVGLELSR